MSHAGETRAQGTSSDHGDNGLRKRCLYVESSRGERCATAPGGNKTLLPVPEVLKMDIAPEFHF